MIRKALPPLVICLLAAGSQADAQSRPPTQNAEDQMSRLYIQMSNLLSGPDPTLKSMLILQRPGTMLPDDFAEKTEEQRMILNEIVDTVPMANPNYVANNNMRYSAIFKAIAQNAQPTVTVGLTKEEKARLNAAYKFINDHRSKYEEYRNKVWDYLDMEDLARRAGEPTSAIARKKAAAQGDWKGFGKRVEYEAALGTIQQLATKDGKAYWNALNERMMAADKDGSLATSFYPQPKDWKADDGWTTITYSASTKVDENKMSREAIDASVKGRHAWFSIDSAFSKTDYSASSLMDHSDLKISFKVKRVHIYRSWFDDLVLKNDAWTLPATVNFKEISFGDLLTNRLKPCAMPVLTTGLLLVKDLKLQTQLSTAEISEYDKKIAAKAKIGLGPFSLSGGYSKDQAGKKSNTTFTATGVNAPDVQILGLIGSAPDRSPASWVK